MTQFLLYIARAGLYLSLFYAFFLLVMRRATFFRLNRLVLLGGSYLCLQLPLVRLRSLSSSGAASQLADRGALELPVEMAAAGVMDWSGALFVLYVAGALVTLGLFGLSALKLSRQIHNGEALERDGCRLVLLEGELPSFSWGRTVVIGRRDFQETPAVFTHELMHVKYRHSLDLLLFLPLQTLLWWNPLVWITREELRLLHEYEADDAVLQQGIDATQYQLLLVRKAVGEQRFSLASGFQHAKLKNRIAMMMKPTSSPKMRWMYLALIPVLVAVMFACNPKKGSKGAVPEAVSYDQVEVKPTFSGGDANTFAQWVYSQIQYPEQAIADGVSGRVMVQFTVGADGTVSQVNVLKGVREDLDAEAVRVISASPQWEPGTQDGKAVPVSFTCPIVFKLN